MIKIMLVVVILCILQSSYSFTILSSNRLVLHSRQQLSMEYIPDGMSKAQWELLKKKEAEANKGKNLGAVGITKFKSRSFEAFQKSGAKNLFPVGPNTPIEERPYMQRPGGMPDGSDLKKKGLQGKGQGKGVKLSAVDAKYDQLGKEGKLASAPFTINWGFAQPEAKEGDAAGKKTATAKKTPTKSTPAKSVPMKSTPMKPTKGKTEPVSEPKKKLFGIF